MKSILLTIVLVVLQMPLSLFAQGSSIKDSFHIQETASANFTLNKSLMNYYGAQALFTAKILKYEDSNIEYEQTARYFRLSNGLDLCRQVFIKKYKQIIVHTSIKFPDVVLILLTSKPSCLKPLDS
jgi:hypothetical protein